MYLLVLWDLFYCYSLVFMGLCSLTGIQIHAHGCIFVLAVSPRVKGNDSMNHWMVLMEGVNYCGIIYM